MRTNVKRNILVLVTLFTLLIAVCTGFFITKNNDKAYADSIDTAKRITTNFEFKVKDSTTGKEVTIALVPIALTNERVVMREANLEIGEKEDYLGAEFSGSVTGINAALLSEFGKKFTDDQSLYYAWSDDKLNVNLYPRIFYDFTYTLATDTLKIKLTLNHAFSEFFDYYPFTNAKESDLQTALTKDITNAQNIFTSWDLNATKQEVAPVTFKWKSASSKWSTVTKFFHVGETPVFTVNETFKYHRVSFKRWSPALTVLNSTDPITYTAVYGNPTVQVTDTSTGQTTTETLYYRSIDEDLLYANFTNEFKDIGSIESMPADLIEFENREDFWFMKRSDNLVVHSIDTNLTLEAVSFQFRKKGTDSYLSFENAKDMFGKYEVNWNWCWYVIKNGGAADSDSIFEQWISCISVMLGGKANKKADLQEDFVNTHYPAAVLQAPDEYDLVYVYYYSVDLADSGEQAKFTYNDNYKKSVLKVKNNLDDTVKEYPFSYDKTRGCYFMLPIDTYWAAMNKVSSKQAEFYGGKDKVKAEISDVRFSVSGFDGTVEYDKELANNLELALTSVIYLYTEKLTPDYNGEYTATIDFTDLTIIQPDRTDNIGSVVDNAGDKISGWWNDVKDKLGNTWKWVKIVFWIVVGIIVVVLVIRIVSFVISLITPRRRR